MLTNDKHIFCLVLNLVAYIENRMCCLLTCICKISGSRSS